MPTLFILLNHDISEAQKQDAKRWGIRHFISLPPALQSLWGNIPAETQNIDHLLHPIKQWLLQNAAAGDFVLIQGDFGACWIMVNFAFENNLVPVYATTDRKAVEMIQPDGSIKTVREFRHVRFRKYGD
jgi:hypothetical protein